MLRPQRPIRFLAPLALSLLTLDATAQAVERTKPTPLDRVANVARPREDEASIRRALAGCEALLEVLPLATLELATLRDDRLELHFDFGDDDELELELPSETRWVLGKKGRPKRVRSEGRSLRVRRRLRLWLDRSGEIRSIGEGDLEVWGGLLVRWIDLSLHTQSGRTRPVLDDDGRPVLAVDRHGAPLRRSGAYVPLEAERWAVLEALGRRVEIPLERGESVQSKTSAASSRASELVASHVEEHGARLPHSAPRDRARGES